MKFIRIIFIFLFITYQIHQAFGRTVKDTHQPTQNNLNQKKNLSPDLNSPINMRDINQFRYVSLVFASQNFRSPISSFGHTLLIFHNHHTPEPDSPTFEYLGTTSVSFFAIRSLFWTIPGYYRLIPWNQKYWEYERENRDIWIIPLKITDTERTKLNQLVKKSLSVTTDPYNFLFTNCSWYIFKILQESLKNINCSVKFYVFPIETLQALQNCKKTSQPVYMPSQATKVAQAVKALNLKEKEIIKNLNLWNFPDPQSFEKDTTKNQYSNKKNKVNATRSIDAIKTALTEWIDYTIPRTDEPEKRDELFKLKKYYHHPLTLKQKDMKEIENKRNGRFTLGLMFGKELRLANLTISPGQLSFLNTIKNDRFWADKLELFTISLAFNERSFFLSSFSIIDMNTSNPGNIVTSSFVRDVYIGYEKYTNGLDKYWENGLVRMGVGLSHDVNEGWRFSILPILESGVSRFYSTENTNNFSFTARLGLTTRMFIRFSSAVRLKAEFYQPILTYKAFISQKGSASIVFFDYYSFVSALHYQTFRTKENSTFHHSFGLSLSRLF